MGLILISWVSMILFGFSTGWLNPGMESIHPGAVLATTHLMAVALLCIPHLFHRMSPFSVPKEVILLSLLAGGAWLGFWLIALRTIHPLGMILAAAILSVPLRWITERRLSSDPLTVVGILAGCFWFFDLQFPLAGSKNILLVGLGGLFLLVFLKIEERALSKSVWFHYSFLKALFALFISLGYLLALPDLGAWQFPMPMWQMLGSFLAAFSIFGMYALGAATRSAFQVLPLWSGLVLGAPILRSLFSGFEFRPLEALAFTGMLLGPFFAFRKSKI